MPHLAFVLHSAVNRRIGGLEIFVMLSNSLITVNRRIGGLEKESRFLILLLFVNRRIGGLETIP